MTTPPSPDELRALIARVTEGWAPEQKAALMRRLQREATRSRVSRTHPSPGALARSVDAGTRQTAALQLIDAAVERCLATRGGRLLVTMPPQEGKSTRVAVWTPIRALVLNPDWRVVIASYGAELAVQHARTSRNLIKDSGSRARDAMTGAPLPDKLGIALAQDKSAAGHWTIEGHRGGLYAVGLEGGLTGRAADLLIIDDPIKDQKDADSAAVREHVWQWWQSVATTRLAPGAPVIVVQTRWHGSDLAGRLLNDDTGAVWDHLNIPARAELGVPDALGREPGEYLVSARDRTPADWAATERSVGPRTWAALYQGIPVPLTGGLFAREWFDRFRRSETQRLTVRVVSVDPAETGKRDEAGVIALGLTPDGRVALTHDVSAKMTSDQWSRAAVLLALQVRAGHLVYEAYTAEDTYRRVLQQAWADVAREAAVLAAHAGDVVGAATELVADEQYRAGEGRELDAVSAHADAVARLEQVVGLPVPSLDARPFRVLPRRGKGDKIARSAGLRQAASTGRAYVVGSLPVFERQAISWQVGQGSPDRMDAAVHGYEFLMELAGQESTVASPVTAPGAPVVQAGFGGIAAQLGAPMVTTMRP